MTDSLNAGKDCFEDLPVDVLELLLSFLPSPDAVQTCVLAKRWRHIWKSVPSIRFYADYDLETWDASNNFVNKLIELRDPTVPLHVCDIFFGDDIDSWLQYAASCRVQVLRVEKPDGMEHPLLSNNSVISEHLTRLELHGIYFEYDHSLDFSRCKALEVLYIDDCIINLGDISAKSLRHLKIKGSELCPASTRTRISAPGLVTCELSDCYSCLTPLFGSLPSVITAFIRISAESEEDCETRGYLKDCEGFCCKDDCSVLLEGLSGATNLELICDPSSVIFTKDLRWRPMFGKRKTVLLSDWCLTYNFTGLIYFLQSSPILERLTLQLSPSLKSFTKMSESYTPREHFLLSKHLKVVEIKSWKARVIKKSWKAEIIQIQQILRLLESLGVTRETINIDKDFWELFQFPEEV